jgi:hypothetical protein
VNKDSMPVFLLFSVELIQLLVEETNKYYNLCLDTPDNGSGYSQFPDVTVYKTHIFLVIII